MARVPSALRDLVRRRAKDACEYCRMPQQLYRTRFQPDHIIPLVHGGASAADNLCWACFHCNLYKGTNLGGIDSKTSKKVWLFDPRRQEWKKHFRWKGAILVGRSPAGRVTIEVMRINDPEYVEAREALIAEGVFP